MARIALTRRRECRALTAGGWLAVLVALGVADWLAVRSIHPFLAITRPVAGAMPAELLAVEGWLPDDALQVAANRFAAGGYRLLVTTGGPVPQGSYLVPYRTYAELARRSLIVLGVDSARVVAVSGPAVVRDRTYTSAHALGDWLLADSTGRWLPPLSGRQRLIDVCSHGPHARRTLLLYRRALGPAYAVGIIAVPDSRYDPARWWRTSDGFRIVVDEIVAYAYARLTSGE